MDSRVTNFTGSLKDYLAGFAQERAQLGYSDTSVMRMLHHFDRFSRDFECHDCLPKELALAWTAHNEHWQSASTQQHRISLLRKFGEYMLRQEQEAYIIPASCWPKKQSLHTPYIFSEEEINKIFMVADSWKAKRETIFSHMLPVLLRMQYGCGMRISETLNLKISDVDTENGVLLISAAKNNRDRYVPMSSGLTTRCIWYKQNYLTARTVEDFFFPSPRGGAYGASYVYHRFRDILQKAGIPHRGPQYGPRLHDLRHTFSVHSLQNMIDQGYDVMEMLPILAAYLGHKTYHGTSLYLHLTTGAYPHIADKTEALARTLYSSCEVVE